VGGKRVKGDGYDQSILYTYENRIMKTFKII
jgi:hypothetical protein